MFQLVFDLLVVTLVLFAFLRFVFWVKGKMTKGKPVSPEPEKGKGENKK